MNYPDFVYYSTMEEYKNHFINKYCQNPIMTFDNILVKFYNDIFEHAFFESSDHKGANDVFSRKRAERIDWIEVVLKDPNAELYVGYKRKRKKNNYNRRVAIINQDNYVVVIQLTGSKRAKFITAFVADSPNTASNIRSNPPWT